MKITGAVFAIASVGCTLFALWVGGVNADWGAAAAYGMAGLGFAFAADMAARP